MRRFVGGWPLFVLPILLVGGCKGEVVTRLDVSGFDQPQQATVQMEAGHEYELWDEYDFALNVQQDDAFCVRWVVSVDDQPMAECVPFTSGDGCSYKRQRADGSRAGDCRLRDCTISVDTTGEHLVSAVLETRPCPGGIQQSFYGEPRFEKLALQVTY